MWKIVEKLVPNLNTPITWKLSERQGRLCDVLSVVPGAVVLSAIIVLSGML